MGNVIAFRRMNDEHEQRRGPDRRSTRRGGRRDGDRKGYAPLVLIVDDNAFPWWAVGLTELTAVVPVALAAKLRRSHFLFLGYEMGDWNLRLILNRIWGERPVAYRSWAVQRSPSPLAQAFWRHYDIAPLDVEPETYVELLGRRLEAV